MATALQREWVARVLGLTLPARGKDSGATTASERLDKARDTWDEAISRVDNQIAALQTVLRNSGDDDLKAIADFGLAGVTGNHKVRLAAALHEARTGTLDEAAALRTADLVADFRKHIASDPRVKACDDNPFGVSVAIRATLDQPLAMLEAALRTSAPEAVE